MISPARLVDFLRDPRMPQYLPYVKLKQLSRRKSAQIDIPHDSTVLVALTFDIEHDLGSWAEKITYDAVEPFLQSLSALAKELGAVFTLFIQGDLVERFGGYLRELKAEHELGLHGYSHELWGREKWFLPHETTSLPVREKLLKQGMKCFADYGLPPPTSFRAPNLVADSHTLRLLEAYGFTVDSSAPSYYGIPPVPTKPLGPDSKLLSIPITSNPFPQFQTRYFIPFAFYEVFTMARLATTDESHFLSYLGEVLGFQVQAGVKPHLVFLAHPWEFKAWADNKRLGHCSSDNYELLKRKLSLLKERYQLKYVSMKELFQFVRPE